MDDHLGRRIAAAKKKIDWFGFFVKFFFGALFGAFVGLKAAGYCKNRLEFVLYIALSSISFGFLAARLGDKFWKNLSYGSGLKRHDN